MLYHLFLYRIRIILIYSGGFPNSTDGKESACNAGDPSVIPGSGRSAGEGIGYPLQYSWASLYGSAGKESACNVKDLGSIPRLGRSPGEGKGYPLQYSGPENSMDCIVHGVAKSPIEEFLSLSLSKARQQVEYRVTDGKSLKSH